MSHVTRLDKAAKPDVKRAEAAPAADVPVRMRRLRSRAAVRRVFAECDVLPRHLVQPFFIVPGSGIAVESSPGSGLWRMSVDRMLEEARKLEGGGVGGVMLFNVPEHKHVDGVHLADQLRPLLDGLAELTTLPGLVSYADVCLCSHLTHGHCGLVHGDEIDNDSTLPVLARMAVLLAEAGADFVAPSDMMDGRVAAIRGALDAAHASQTGIVSYAVKMASAFYGPFRDAAESAPAFGDRASYQMPAGNRREARREWQLDAEEGADALLFKPALTNLDLIRDARDGSDLPLFAYQVSRGVCGAACCRKCRVTRFRSERSQRRYYRFGARVPTSSSATTRVRWWNRVSGYAAKLKPS